MSENDFQDRQLIQSFRDESMEHLELVEEKLLELEEKGVQPETLNQVFRSIHTIKGGSGFLGFQTLQKLSHRMENILDSLRRHELGMSSHIADQLLRGTDLLKAMLADLDHQDDVDIALVIESMDRIIKGEHDQPPSLTKEQFLETITVQLVDHETSIHLHEKGHHFYFFYLPKAPHRKKMQGEYEAFETYLNAFGRLIAEDGTLEEPEVKSSAVVFATVLEDEFATASLYVEDEAIQELTREELDQWYGAAATAPESEPESAAEARNEPVLNASVTPKPAAPPKKVPATPAVSTPEPSSPKRGESSRKAAAEDSSIRVSTSLLNKLMSLSGELILCRNQLVRELGDSGSQVISSLSQQLSELQESIMTTRLQRVGILFNKVPRIVRDLSKQLDKRIQVELDGTDVELDRTIIDAINDPLTHIVRNSVDHGIEPPLVREQAGKNPVGVLCLKAYHEGGQVNLEIKDDGKGMDVETIKTKAVEKGLISARDADSMGKREALSLIFRPGFSTVDEVTDMSGRGVGMDVVRTSFERLGGSIDLNTDVGRGTTILVKLPTTLAIVPSIIVKVEAESFAIPQTNIQEIVRIKESELHEKLERLGHLEVFRLRGKILPVIRLADVLTLPRTFIDADGQTRLDRRQNLADRRSGPPPVDQTTGQITERGPERRTRGRNFYMMIVRVGVNVYGMLINRIENTEEVVVKPLSAFIKDVKCFHGATIRGDGQVILIIDVNGVASHARLKFEELNDLEAKLDTEQANLKETQDLLVFTNHPEEYFAIPLFLIKRVEKVEASSIENIGDKEFIRLGGKNVELIRVENKLKVKKGEPADDGTVCILIPNLKDVTMGIVAPQVLDVETITVDIQTDIMKSDGVLGTTSIHDHMTVVLDIYGILDRRPQEKRGEQFDKVRILLAEDTPFFRSTISKYLKEVGYSVTTAVDGLDAWERLQEEHFHMVLSDIEMPRMDGFELVQRIRATSEYAHMPVMAITALDQQSNVARGKQAGFDAYLIKLDREALLAKVASLIKISRESVRGG